MAGRVWSWMSAFCRGLLFGIMLGLLLGGGFGTFLLPVVGTIAGGFIGAVVGAIAGLGAAPLVALATLVRPSLIADRFWPGVVTAGVAYAVVTEVVFSGSSLWTERDIPYQLVLVLGSGALGTGFGGAIVRGMRIRSLRTPLAAVFGSAIGAMVAASRVIALEGLNDPGSLAGMTFGGWVAGGILGLTLVAFNLLFTEEPAAA